MSVPVFVVLRCFFFFHSQYPYPTLLACIRLAAGFRSLKILPSSLKSLLMRAFTVAVLSTTGLRITKRRVAFVSRKARVSPYQITSQKQHADRDCRDHLSITTALPQGQVNAKRSISLITDTP